MNDVEFNGYNKHGYTASYIHLKQFIPQTEKQIEEFTLDYIKNYIEKEFYITIGFWGD